MSPSSVLDDEDNMDRTTFLLSSLLYIAMFSYYCKIFPELRGTPVVSRLGGH